MPPITPQQPKPTEPSSGSTPPAGFGSGVAAVEQQKTAMNLKTTEEKYKRTRVLWFITMGALAIAVLVAIGFAVVYGQATAANKKQFDQGYTEGSEEQKAKDAEEATRQGLSDTRGYTAPKELGGFSMQIPKSFSISTNKSGKDVLIMIAHPDKVDTLAKEQAFRLTVKDELYSKVRDSYDKQAKEKRNGVTAGEDIKISDRDAVRYTGKFDRRDKEGTLVLVEYLDKTLIFQTDDNSNTTLIEAYRNILNSVILP
jgi:hypothetical protein